MLCCAPALAVSAAYNPLDATCNTPGASSSTACHTTGQDTVSGNTGELYKTARVFAIITAIAATIVIIVGALNYITAGGDAQKAAGARRMMLGAVIGLVVVALAGGIVTFIINQAG